MSVSQAPKTTITLTEAERREFTRLQVAGQLLAEKIKPLLAERARLDEEIDRLKDMNDGLAFETLEAIGEAHGVEIPQRSLEFKETKDGRLQLIWTVERRVVKGGKGETPQAEESTADTTTSEPTPAPTAEQAPAEEPAPTEEPVPTPALEEPVAAAS